MDIKMSQFYLGTMILKFDLPEAVGPEIKIILDFKSMINLA